MTSLDIIFVDIIAEVKGKIRG